MTKDIYIYMRALIFDFLSISMNIGADRLGFQFDQITQRRISYSNIVKPFESKIFAIIANSNYMEAI